MLKQTGAVNIRGKDDIVSNFLLALLHCVKSGKKTVLAEIIFIQNRYQKAFGIIGQYLIR